MIPAGMFLLTSVALAVSVVRLSKKRTLVQELYCIEMLARVILPDIIKYYENKQADSAE